MLARRAGLLDWSSRSAKWAVVAVAIALCVGALAQRTINQDMQAADPVATAEVRPA